MRCIAWAAAVDHLGSPALLVSLLVSISAFSVFAVYYLQRRQCWRSFCHLFRGNARMLGLARYHVINSVCIRLRMRLFLYIQYATYYNINTKKMVVPPSTTISYPLSHSASSSRITSGNSLGCSSWNSRDSTARLQKSSSSAD
jgi:hypothetical protein